MGRVARKAELRAVIADHVCNAGRRELPSPRAGQEIVAVDAGRSQVVAQHLVSRDPNIGTGFLLDDLERNGDRVRLITRNGYDWTKRYPWIVESALKNRQKQSVIDGEAVIV